jgi:hypothetical protein
MTCTRASLMKKLTTKYTVCCTYFRAGLAFACASRPLDPAADEFITTAPPPKKNVFIRFIIFRRKMFTLKSWRN